jgi:serine/threonine protein kinase
MKDQPQVLLERIFLENEKEYFLFFNEYNRLINDPVYKTYNIIKYYDYQYDNFQKEFYVLREYSVYTLEDIILQRKKSKKFFSNEELLQITNQIVGPLCHLEMN